MLGPADIWISVTNGAGTVTNASGMGVNQYKPVVVKTWGRTHFNHIASATGSLVNLTPLNP